MRQKVGPIVRVLAVLCLLVCAGNAAAQEESDLSARQRVFTGVGPGLRTIKRGADGRLYILASPSPGLLAFDAQGKQVLSINEMGTPPSGSRQGHPLITFGEDCDGAADGKIYVADRGANLIQVFAADGAPSRSIPVNAPVAVAALSEGEVAVATLREPHLVIVFDKNGRDVREFGDPEPLSEREDYNRYLSIGQLATDAQGHLYYAFSYVPEPTVRQYDRLGYAGQDFQYTAVEAFATAQAARKEMERQESKGKQPSFKRVLTAVGVDRTNGEVWIALYNRLLHFDKEGNRRATYKIYTPQGARLEANTILVEQDRLIIGSDPLGIYEFERPDKKNSK
jgi:predicted DNA-binding WGR domain protein